MYKNAWRVPWSTANYLYTFSTAEGGHECPLPSGVLTKYTVRVSKLLLTNCVQSNDDCLEVLPHINFELSTRKPRTIRSPGHANSQFFEILYFQEFCLCKTKTFFPKIHEKSSKKFAGLRPALPPYGAAPLPPTKVGAKFLAALVLAHHDRVRSLLTEALLQHVDQCMRHEDIVIRFMLAQFARKLTEWHCNSFTDLINKMMLWDWNVANKDFWPRLAKSLHSQKVSVTWAGKMDSKLASVLVPGKLSLAIATRSIRSCKIRIE